MSTVPEWAVKQLGDYVRLKHEIEAGNVIYTYGHVGRLISIQAGQPHYATIALDLTDEGYEENVPFDWIEPYRV